MTQHDNTPRRRQGQTLVEFALTLPILLLLMFGIIEFGRIFQAWVTIQNAARAAARYAVTGKYDTNVFPDGSLENEWTPTVNGYAGDGIPCKYDPADAAGEIVFRNHWSGLDCDPTRDEHNWLRRDILRLTSITEAARVGAAGLQLIDDMDIPGTGIG